MASFNPNAIPLYAILTISLDAKYHTPEICERVRFAVEKMKEIKEFYGHYDLIINDMNDKIMFYMTNADNKVVDAYLFPLNLKIFDGATANENISDFPPDKPRFKPFPDVIGMTKKSRPMGVDVDISVDGYGDINVIPYIPKKKKTRRGGKKHKKNKK